MRGKMESRLIFRVETELDMQHSVFEAEQSTNENVIQLGKEQEAEYASVRGGLNRTSVFSLFILSKISLYVDSLKPLSSLPFSSSSNLWASLSGP